MQTQNEPSSMEKELSEYNKQMKVQKSLKGASAEEKTELPEGAAPLEAQESEVPPSPEEEAPAPAPEPEPEELITIRGRTFKSQAEAIKYAEQLEDDKLAADAYNQGIRDTLQSRVPVEQAQPEVDDFDEKFYANPKETLKKIKEEAKAEALAVVDAREREEKAWKIFSETYPELADSRREVERILQENWSILGKMTDTKRAMEILATKTRSYFNEIADRIRPRTELPKKQGQVVSAGSGSAPRVTPQAKVEKPLDFVSEMKKLKERR